MHITIQDIILRYKTLFYTNCIKGMLYHGYTSTNASYKTQHPEKNKLYQYRSNAKTFIKHYADKDDLDKLISLAQEQKAKLTN